jgi:PAS domain S-box-containing protein
MNELITNKMPSGIITLGRDGEITGHNPASERIFEGELTRNSLFRDVVRESDALQALLDRCLKQGEVFTRVEFNAPTANGDKRIGINLSPITNQQGTIEGAICLLSDLTEIVELQRQMKLQEHFAALGEMSAGIAHEFKNAIATILGYAQLSRYEPDLQTIQGYAREIQKESQSLSAVVTDFLNFARPVNAEIDAVDLVELLDTVMADLKSHRPGNYELTLQGKGPAVVPCDAILMRQAFLNLLINAVEAMEANGQAFVRVDNISDRGKSYVRIIFEDSGPGIPVDQMAKIFLPFFTTKSHGTGLGLSLVQKAVIAHKGRIEAENSESGGARFVVTLPLLAQPAS